MADDTTVSESIEAGMDLFVTKPFTYEVLAELLRPVFAPKGQELIQGLGLGLKLGELGLGRGLGQGHGLGQGLGYGSGRTPRTNKMDMVDVFETIHEDTDTDALPYSQSNSNHTNRLLPPLLAVGGGPPATAAMAINETTSTIKTNHFQPSLSSKTTNIKIYAENERNDIILDVPLTGTVTPVPSQPPFYGILLTPLYGILYTIYPLPSPFVKLLLCQPFSRNVT